jgi:ABC-type transport system substrate-binding protein
MLRRVNLSIPLARTLLCSRSSPFFSSLGPPRLCGLCVNVFSVFSVFLTLAAVSLYGCSHHNQSDPSSLTFLIESSPTNLDPRFATDSQSQRLDGLLFSGLLERDNQMNFHGDLAESWSTPDPLTYVFRLRRGVRFHDGRTLTATDVKATFDFIRNPANKTPKQGALRMVASIETPDDATVIFHLSQPYASFSVNLIPSAIGIVPANAGADFSSHPIGSGPFRFVQQSQDEEVVVLGGQAKLAAGVLPPDHWAAEPNVAQYPYDPVRAEQALEAAGFPRKQDGVRLHLTLKCSTEEQARLIGAALQEQWRRVGIQLELRPLELATLFSDVAKGNFQITYQRWVGANTDPDFFEYAFSSKRFPPDGANRGHYRNARVDTLTDQIRVEMNQEKRKALCSEVQKILAEDLPYLPLWFNDVVSVHRRSLGTLDLPSTGNYNFLSTFRAPDSQQ